MFNDTPARKTDLTRNSQSVFRAGVSLNIHSFMEHWLDKWVCNSSYRLCATFRESVSEAVSFRCPSGRSLSRGRPPRAGRRWPGPFPGSYTWAARSRWASPPRPSDRCKEQATVSDSYLQVVTHELPGLAEHHHHTLQIAARNKQQWVTRIYR